MAPDAAALRPEAEATQDAITAVLTTAHAHIYGVLDGVNTTAKRKRPWRTSTWKAWPQPPSGPTPSPHAG